MRMFILFVTLFFIVLNSAFAVEVAPRISDREIIESLTRLEAGINANRQAIEANHQAINANRQAIEANRQAIRQLGKEFSKELDEKLYAFRSELLGFMKWGFGLLLTGMFILFGFILWDRQSTLKPIKDEMDALEKKKVNRLIATLKKLSEHDMKIADAMRSTRLL